MTKWISLVLTLLCLGCTPVTATKTPVYEVPNTSKQAPTPLILPIGTSIPQSQNKKLKTPAIQATEKYKRGLNTVEELVRTALVEDKSIDAKWKQSLYHKIEKLMRIAPDPLYPKTERLLADMRLGLELRDNDPINKALRNIQEINSMIK